MDLNIKLLGKLAEKNVKMLYKCVTRYMTNEEHEKYHVEFDRMRNEENTVKFEMMYQLSSRTLSLVKIG